MLWEHRPSPNHSGPRAATLGVVIHSTRGGASSQEREYEATCNWFSRPASEVSAHRVIGFDGNGAICIEDDLVAWHATNHNFRWLGVELTQPTINDAYSEAQYATLRALLKEWRNKYGFPLDRDHLVAHSEINSQKSDPGPLFDWEKVLEDDMQSIVDSLNKAWSKLDEIQAKVGPGVLVDLAEEVKQQIVEIKVAIGLQ